MIVLCLKFRLSELFKTCPEIFDSALRASCFFIKLFQRFFVAADSLFSEAPHAVDVFSELADILAQISDGSLSILKSLVEILSFDLYALNRALRLTHLCVSVFCGFAIVGKGALQYLSELIDLLSQGSNGIQKLLRAFFKALIIQTGINRNGTVGIVCCHVITSLTHYPSRAFS